MEIATKMAQLTKGGVQQMIQNGPAPFRLQIIGKFVLSTGMTDNGHFPHFGSSSLQTQTDVNERFRKFRVSIDV